MSPEKYTLFTLCIGTDMPEQTMQSHIRCCRIWHLIWPRGYKTFFMLNSAEHEICPANKSQITDNCKFFLAKHTVAEHENFSADKYENANYCWHFHIY